MPDWCANLWYERMSLLCFKLYRLISSVVEQSTHNRSVTGSTPVSITQKASSVVEQSTHNRSVIGSTPILSANPIRVKRHYLVKVTNCGKGEIPSFKLCHAGVL